MYIEIVKMSFGSKDEVVIVEKGNVGGGSGSLRVTG